MVGWGNNVKRPLSSSVQLLHQGVNHLEFYQAVLAQIAAPGTYEYFKRLSRRLIYLAKIEFKDSPKIAETL